MGSSNNYWVLQNSGKEEVCLNGQIKSHKSQFKFTEGDEIKLSFNWSKKAVQFEKVGTEEKHKITADLKAERLWFCFMLGNPWDKL